MLIRSIQHAIKIWLLTSTIWAYAETPDKFDLAAELYQQNNYRDAFSAFLAMAEKGDPRAQTVTALMYKFGEGIEQDLPLAFHWYSVAANQGYPAAQYHSGVMLANGMGVDADRDKAIKWLTRASEGGFSRAIDELANLNASAGVLGRSEDKLTPWSKNWDLRLPSDLVLLDHDIDRPVASDKVYLVQVGAMRTRADANRLWQVLTSHHTTLFKGREPIITLAENAERRIYRIQTGPFSDFKSADEFCGHLMASTIQAGCLPLQR